MLTEYSETERVLTGYDNSCPTQRLIPSFKKVDIVFKSIHHLNIPHNEVWRSF